MSPRAVGKIMLLFLVCACCPIGFAHAEDITTRDGRVFKNASAVKFEADGVVIKHDGGTKQIAWAELPAPLRQRYQAAARQQKEAEIQRLKQDLARAEADAAKLNQTEAQPKNEPKPSAAALVKPSDSTNPHARTPGPAEPAAELTSVKGDEIVDAADLVQQFKTDSTAAEERCQKKTLRVKGVIERFEAKLFRRQYEVILESPEKFLRVVMRFDYPDDFKSIYTIQNGQKLAGRPAENNEVTLMTVGDAVVFQGRCKGLRDAEIIFTGCKMVR
jgi:hypothetical protein